MTAEGLSAVPASTGDGTPEDIRTPMTVAEAEGIARSLDRWGATVGPDSTIAERRDAVPVVLLRELDRLRRLLPPAGLPATLRSEQDIAQVCEAAGLERLTGEDVHPNAWVTPDRTVGVAVAGIVGMTISGIWVQRSLGDWDDQKSQQLVSVQPFSEASFLWAAIRLAIHTTAALPAGTAVHPDGDPNV